MKRWKCISAYDGTGYCGWQSQLGGNTVQDLIETRLEVIFKKKIRIHGSGRTDSGVHADGQVFHFDADWKYGHQKLLLAMNSKMPDDIQVLDIKEVEDDFHARFSAKKKRYVYHFYQGEALPKDTRYTWSVGRELDVEKMRKAASYLLGHQDFTSFSASRGDGSKESPMKTMYRMDILGSGKKIRLVTEGSGYLYKMVRSIAGLLVEVGLGKLTPADVKKLLNEKKRTRLVPTAPAKGLFLMKVFY